MKCSGIHRVQDWFNNNLKYLPLVFPSDSVCESSGPSWGEWIGGGPCIGVGQAHCCLLRTWKARWDEGCGRFDPTSHRRKWFKTTSQAASEESAFQLFSWTLSLRLNLSSAINTNLESKLKSVKDRTIGEWARLKRARDLFHPRGCSVWESNGYGHGLFAALLVFNARRGKKRAASFLRILLTYVLKTPLLFGILIKFQGQPDAAKRNIHEAIVKIIPYISLI